LRSCFRPAAALNIVHGRRPLRARRNIRTLLDEAGWKADGEQGESVRRLREVEPEIFLIWQVRGAAATAAGTPGLGVAAAAASDQGFMAALQTTSQLQQIQEFGDNRLLMLDTTFTTNALKVSCRYPWQLMTWCAARSALPLCYPRSTL
jgi:hypothetical protein